MSFFDKLKSGVSEAGNKAKIMVEQNKLKLSNVSKQSQIDKLHKEIGSKLAELHFIGEPISVDIFKSQLEQIAVLKLEIEQNEHEIAMLGEEKQCKQCGKDNPLNAKTCFNCQTEFDIINVNKHEVIEPVLIKDKAKEE